MVDDRMLGFHATQVRRPRGLLECDFATAHDVTDYAHVLRYRSSCLV
jgi:hypothetical protein